MKVLVAILICSLLPFIEGSPSRRRWPFARRRFQYVIPRNRIRDEYRNIESLTRNYYSPNKVSAVCNLVPGLQHDIAGRIDFFQNLDENFEPVGELRVKVEINGVPPNDQSDYHGLHIHEFGDLSDGCQATGSHYNPFNVDHGGRRSNPRHLGDMGNVRRDANGMISAFFSIPNTSLVGYRSIIGRAVVLHAGEDDLGRGNNEGSRTTGNAGGRLTCCTIGRANHSQYFI